jgi:CRP-like cAMP-binding protein
MTRSVLKENYYHFILRLIQVCEGAGWTKPSIDQIKEAQMPSSFNLEELNIPQSSEIHTLIKRCPDIKMFLFSDDEYLIRENDASVDTFIVLCGNYVVEQLRSGPEKMPPGMLDIVTDDHNSISFVGEMAYLGGGFRTASVRSSGKTYTLCLKPEYLEVIISEFPSFTSILCKQFTSRLTEANRLLKEADESRSMESKLIIKKAGEMVMKRGEKAETLYQLVDGVLVGEDKKDTSYPANTLLGFLDPGPFFRDGEYGTTVKAKTVAYLTAISKNSKLIVIRNFPELILKLYQGDAESG